MRTPGWFYDKVRTICGYDRSERFYGFFEKILTEPISEAMYRSIRHHTMAYEHQLVAEDKAPFVLRSILWDLRYVIRKRLNLQ